MDSAHIENDYSLSENNHSLDDQEGNRRAIEDFEMSELEQGMMKTDDRVNEDNQIEHHSHANGSHEDADKSEDVHDFFDHTIHAPSLTSDDMPNAELDMAVFDRDSLERLALEKMSEEKTVFSVNLGLIPADTESKVLAQKAKNSTRGVLTRKGFEDLTSNNGVNNFTNNSIVSSLTSNCVVNNLDDDIREGHRHSPGTVYRCGACEKTFTTICRLHDHLQVHSFSGSYHFDNIFKIAFPKYDTVCMTTQTSWNEDDDDCPQLEASKPKRPGRPRKNFSHFGKGILISKPHKLKKDHTLPKFKIKKDTNELKNTTEGVRRKRGRPRKNPTDDVKASQENMSGKNKSSFVKDEKKIAKLKVKTDDGGNTWKGIAKKKNNDDTEVDHPEMGDSCEIEANDNNEEFVIEVEHENLFEDECSPDKKNETTEDTVTTPEDVDVRKSRKRKMSIPRKVLVKSNKSDGVKIINSRQKPEFRITCDFCPAKFQYTRGLIRHEVEKHPEEMKFECDICDMKFMRQYNLDRHKLCIHSIGKPPSSLRNGGRGGKVMRGKFGRRVRVQTPDTSMTCEMCGKMVPETRIDTHRRIHTGERPFICHVCGKGLISDKKLKRHLLIHSQVNRHTCDVCGQGFSMKYKLRTHMFQHTGHKPYLCSVCGAEFNNSTSLLHHHRTQHLGDKRFECNICGGRYGKKSQLDEHMFSHSDIRTHVCKYCSKTFKHAKSLRRHETSHVSDQKFACDQCDSKFSRKDNLERHKMCHVDVSLHCRFCRKKFLDSKLLLEHEQNHINQKRFTCRICKERFQNETYFNNHIEKVHQLDKDNLAWDDDMLSNDRKEDKSVDDEMSASNIVLNAMKLSAVPGTEHLTVSMPFSGPADTLNLSMNVAGIIPSSVQDLIPNGSMHTILVSHNGSEGYTIDQSAGSNLSLVSARNILNQSLGQSYVTSANMIQMGTESQRQGMINSMDGGLPLRLSADQQTDNLTLVTTTDHMIIHEQQRLMQEALGSSMNMQNSGFRMQNMF